METVGANLNAAPCTLDKLEGAARPSDIATSTPGKPRMNILLSAFAFAPGTGSEPGVGWNFAMMLNRAGHQVTVLTKPHSRHEILAALAADPALARIRVEFVGSRPPQLIHRVRLFHQVYYLFWQVLALKAAKRLHRAQPFDIAHAVTTSGIRFPSFLGALQIPFLLGPIGGGETMPPQLRRTLPPVHRLAEFARSLSTALLSLDPLMRRTFRSATVILARTADTASAIGKAHQQKVRQTFGIGIEPETIVPAPRRLNRGPRGDFRILFVARLVYWKGGDLALAAVARAAASLPEASLTVVGRGPERQHLHRRAEELGIATRVIWRHDWMDARDLERLYEEHDVMLFPSMHEAGGTVVLEAFAKAMPVVCLDIGGPGQIVAGIGGDAVPTRGVPVNQIVDGLAEALVKLALEPGIYHQRSKAAWEDARLRDWRNEVETAYSFLEKSQAARRPL